MFKLLTSLPDTLTVAVSGGVDSVAVVDFLSRNHAVKCAFFHHGTVDSDRAMKFVETFCNERALPLTLGGIAGERGKSQSPEEFWRDQRYSFLESLDGIVVTGHNLDDCVETYLHSCLHGTPKVIPMSRNNVVRPFLTTRKSEFVDWCTRKGVAWCEDESNQDTRYMRNFIRHELVKKALIVNPGLYKTVMKIVEQSNKFMPL